MILNLTQHVATPAQREEGVLDITDTKVRELVVNLLTIDDLPDDGELRHRAEGLLAVCQSLGFEAAMIGGQPALMGWVIYTLATGGVKPYYAFSKRVSKEETADDGSVRKTQVFKHLGLIPATGPLAEGYNDGWNRGDMMIEYEPPYSTG